MKKFKIFFSLLLTLALMLQLGAVALAAPDNAAEFKPEAGFSYRLTAELDKTGEDGQPVEGETELVPIDDGNAAELGEGFSVKLGNDAEGLAQDARLTDVLDKDIAISVPAGYYVSSLALRAKDDETTEAVDLLKIAEADADSANIKLKAGALTIADEAGQLYLDSRLITGDAAADAFVLDITLRKLDADAPVEVTVDSNKLEASTEATADAPAVFTAPDAPEFDANLRSFSGWKLLYANGSSVMVAEKAEFSPYASCTLEAVFAPVVHTVNVIVSADKSEYTVGETPVLSSSVSEEGYTADVSYSVTAEDGSAADLASLAAGTYTVVTTVSNVQRGGAAIPAENLNVIVNNVQITVKAAEAPTEPDTPTEPTENPTPSDDPSGGNAIIGGGGEPAPAEPTQLTITVKAPVYNEQTKQFENQGYEASGLAEGDTITAVEYIFDDENSLFTISKLEIVDSALNEVPFVVDGMDTYAVDNPKYRLSIVGAPAEVPAPQSSAVTVTVNNPSFTYNGKAQAPAKTDCTVSGLDESIYTLNLTFKGETDAGTKNAVLESWNIVQKSNSTDVASNTNPNGYTVNVTGTFTIAKRDATISVKDNIKFTTNGVTAFKLDKGNINATGMADDHVYALSSHFEKGSVKVESPTEAGEYTIVIDKCEIYDKSQIKDGKATGDPLTANYNLTKNNGKVTITVNANAIPLTITAKSGTFEYDGSAKTVEGWESVDGLKDGDKLESVKYKSSATQTIPGESSAEIESVVIKDKNGSAVAADKYTVNLNPGKITVTKPKLTLTAVSDEKTYDGKALSNNNVKASRDLSKTNFKLSVGLSVTDKAGNSVRNGPVNVGTYTKKISSVKITLNGNDVTEYFDVTCVDGTLTVKSGSGSSSNAGVKTGDEANIGLWIGILAACAVVIIVIVIILLKKRKSGDAAEAEELPAKPVEEAEDKGFEIDTSVFDEKNDENK